jgi:uncharacterized protein
LPAYIYGMKRMLTLLFRTFIAVFAVLNIMAAFHAWKFTHFYDDPALKRPKPDKMGGWDKTKAILFGIRYPKSQNTVTPDSGFTTVTLTTPDEVKLSSWHFKKQTSKGTVALFHGHASSKSKIIEEAIALYNMGYNVLLTDFRAHGNSEGNTCTIGYDEANDVKAVYDYITSAGEKNIILWGISLGAATITRAVSEYKLQPAKIILEMPFGRLTDAVKGRVRLMGLPEQPTASLLTFWGGAEQGFWGFNHSPVDYAKNIHCPVLLQWGRNDLRVTQTETSALFENLATKQKKWVVYETAGHESLLKNQPAKWRQEVGAFLESIK